RPLQTPHGNSFPRGSTKRPAEGFLESFQKDDAGGDADKSPAPDNDALKKEWQALERSHERLLLLEERLNAARAAKDAKTLKEVQQRLSELAEETDKEVATMEKDLARSRRVRSKDPVPQ